MKRASPQTLLLVMLLVVPLVVAGATLLAFLLLRAGYGLLLGALLPYGASLFLIVAIGVLLGRAASGGRGDGGPPGGGRDGARSRGPDDV